MSSALKFLHASDLHLDRPLAGLAEIPAHLKETLANAPYAAAERLFDLAISERVDFLLLAGDVVDLEQGGPRSTAFLLGQFQRLADRNIRVYWCGGSVDRPDHWPSVMALPDNVILFPSSLVEQVVHTRDKQPLATIWGAGMDHLRRKPSDFNCVADSVFPIGLVHGKLDWAAGTAKHIRYWALGGLHQRKVHQKGSVLAVYPGTTQSRGPDEPGAHGCTLVLVDPKGDIQLQDLELDSIRWSLQQITVAENADTKDLQEILADRCQKIGKEYPDQLVLARWKIATTGDFNPQLRQPERLQELVRWLRNEHGQSRTGLWTVDFQVQPPRSLPGEWYQEETILGEFLRAVRHYQADGDLDLGLSRYATLDRQGLNDEMFADLGRIPSEGRDEILQAAALVGIDYLAAPDSEKA